MKLDVFRKTAMFLSLVLALQFSAVGRDALAGGISFVPARTLSADGYPGGAVGYSGDALGAGVGAVLALVGIAGAVVLVLTLAGGGGSDSQKQQVAKMDASRAATVAQIQSTRAEDKKVQDQIDENNLKLQKLLAALQSASADQTQAAPQGAAAH